MPVRESIAEPCDKDGRGHHEPLEVVPYANPVANPIAGCRSTMLERGRDVSPQRNRSAPRSIARGLNRVTLAGQLADFVAGSQDRL